MARLILGSHSRSCANSSALMVYSNCEPPALAPMRKSCTGVMNSLAPGSLDNLARKRLTTSSALASRSWRGFKVMNICAALRWLLPVKPVTFNTAGSA